MNKKRMKTENGTKTYQNCQALYAFECLSEELPKAQFLGNYKDVKKRASLYLSKLMLYQQTLNLHY